MSKDIYSTPCQDCKGSGEIPCHKCTEKEYCHDEQTLCDSCGSCPTCQGHKSMGLWIEEQCKVISPQCGTCDKFEKACSGGLIKRPLTVAEVEEMGLITDEHRILGIVDYLLARAIARHISGEIKLTFKGQQIKLAPVEG